MFTVLWAKTLCLYNVTVCVSLPMRAEALFLRLKCHLFLRSVNHYTLSGVCEKRWRRNQAGGRLRRFHLPLSLTLSTLYSFTHSLSSLSLSLAHSQRKQHWCLAAQIGCMMNLLTHQTQWDNSMAATCSKLCTHTDSKWSLYITKHTVTSVQWNCQHN